MPEVFDNSVGGVMGATLACVSCLLLKAKV